MNRKQRVAMRRAIYWGTIVVTAYLVWLFIKK